jgi:drug/metabolite transporter (DMT)-like permease
MRRSAVPVPVLLGVTMLFWGAAFSVTDVALDYTTPGIVACLRALLGAAALIVLLPLLGGRLPRSRWLWGWAAVAGAGAVTLSLMGLSEGTSRAGPAVAAVLLNSAPFFVAIIGRLALDERITALRTAGLVVGFAGVALIILSDPGDVGSGSDLIIGCALTLVGAIGYACGGLAMRYVYLREPDVDVIGFSVAQFVCGGVLLIPYALLSGDPGSTDWGSVDLWWSLIFLALGAQVIAFVCFMLALGRWPGSRVYAWTFLAPAVAVVIEALRGDLPGALTTLGMLVVIAGVAIVNLPQAEAPDAEEDALPERTVA